MGGLVKTVVILSVRILWMTPKVIVEVVKFISSLNVCHKRRLLNVRKLSHWPETSLWVGKGRVSDFDG